VEDRLSEGYERLGTTLRGNESPDAEEIDPLMRLFRLFLTG
jgi:hypothetical protein